MTPTGYSGNPTLDCKDNTQTPPIVTIALTALLSLTSEAEMGIGNCIHHSSAKLRHVKWSKERKRWGEGGEGEREERGKGVEEGYVNAPISAVHLTCVNPHLLISLVIPAQASSRVKLKSVQPKGVPNFPCDSPVSLGLGRGILPTRSTPHTTSTATHSGPGVTTNSRGWWVG